MKKKRLGAPQTWTVGGTRATGYAPEDFASVTTTLVRTDKPDPATNEEAVALWRISVKDGDERKVGRAVSNAVTSLDSLSLLEAFVYAKREVTRAYETDTRLLTEHGDVGIEPSVALFDSLQKCVHDLDRREVTSPDPCSKFCSRR